MSSSWSERMRLIRFRRKREKFSFWREFAVVPRWLVVMMATLYVIAIVSVLIVNARSPEGLAPPNMRDDALVSALVLTGVVTAIAIPASAVVFLVGYVYRDAKRRGMSAGAWTFLVIALMPAYLLLGFIVYFVMREPLPYDCPQCGTIVGARFNFCPNCKCDLHPSCPQCKREVLDSDKFCSFCGQPLPGQPTTVAPITPLPEDQPAH